MRRALLTVVGDAGEGSPNRRRHWRADSALKQKWRLLAGDAWNRAGCPVFHRKVRLSFTVYRGRKMDESNLAASLCLVALENGLKGRAFEEDSPEFVERGRVSQVTGVAYGASPRVEVLIEEIEEGDGAA